MAEEEEKGPLEKPLDWLAGLKSSFARVRQRFGLPVALLLALLVPVGLIWWNWEDIAKRPGAEWIVGKLDEWRQPMPKAVEGRLNIAVTHLAEDDGRKQEKLLLEELGNFEGVNLLLVKRTVDPGPEQPNKTEAEENARGLLKQTGADVLIWGSVISLGGKSAMRLYWTPSREVSGAKASGKYQPQTETIALPEAFWSDLKQILGLLTQTRLAELTFGQEGHYVVDKLEPLIRQVRALADSKEGVWNLETLAGVRFSLAAALETLGEQSGKDEPLNESVGLYQKVLDEWTREKVPLDWAATQNNLGNALFRLGERESGTRRLEEAVAAFRAAMEERTRERVPLDWAKTQNNLGNALRVLGERERGTQRLEEAVAASRAALTERTRARVPLDWAATQVGLGAALETLGERESGTQRLEEAVAAYRAALEEYTRERVPLDWAMTQNNLGNALGTLGERESGTQRLAEAVAAYRAALEENTRERVPLDWAATQNNLGNALATLGERESGTQRLEEAVAAYRAALEEWTETAAPNWHKIAQENLDKANALLAKRRGTAPAHQSKNRLK